MNISVFFNGKAYFGGFPSQKDVELLENLGVKTFVDLTYGHEKGITKYYTKYEYINYPIRDRSVPNNLWSFAVLILKIEQIFKNNPDNHKIYIHCKGGHGRSGILVACLLCHIDKIDPIRSIEKTTVYHNKRPIMKEKWKKLGSPQTYKQKQFVINFFKPIYQQPLNSYYPENFLYTIKTYPLLCKYLFNSGLRPIMDFNGFQYKNLTNIRNQLYINMMRG